MDHSTALPFANTKIFLHIRLTNDLKDHSKHDAKKIIKKLGGMLTLNPNDANIVVFHHGSDALLQNAMATGKQVVTIDYLYDCRKSGKRIPIEPRHVPGCAKAAAWDFDPVSKLKPTASYSEGVSSKAKVPYLLDDEEANDRQSHPVSSTTNVAVEAPSIHNGVDSVHVEMSTQKLDENVCAILGEDAISQVRDDPVVSKQRKSKRPHVVAVESEVATTTNRKIVEVANMVAVAPVAAEQEAAVCRRMKVPPTLVTITGPEDEKGMMMDILAALGAECSLKVFGRVKKPSHFVVLSDAMTPKILLARITGAPMLTREWVTDSLSAGFFVEPLPRHFHPLYVPPPVRAGPPSSAVPQAETGVSASLVKRRRIEDLEHHRRELCGTAAKHPNSLLLERCTFFLLGHCENPPNDVYAELLKLMGAHVVRTITNADLTAAIEVDGGVARNTQLSESEKERLKGIHLVSTAWIVETASTCQFASLEKHTIPVDAVAAPLSPLVMGLNPLAKTKRGPSSAVKYASNQLSTQQLNRDLS